jgi:hypothetical protein
MFFALLNKIPAQTVFSTPPERTRPTPKKCARRSKHTLCLCYSDCGGGFFMRAYIWECREVKTNAIGQPVAPIAFEASRWHQATPRTRSPSSLAQRAWPCKPRTKRAESTRSSHICFGRAIGCLLLLHQRDHTAIKMPPNADNPSARWHPDQEKLFLELLIMPLHKPVGGDLDGQMGQSLETVWEPLLQRFLPENDRLQARKTSTGQQMKSEFSVKGLQQS